MSVIKEEGDACLEGCVHVIVEELSFLAIKDHQVLPTPRRNDRKT